MKMLSNLIWWKDNELKSMRKSVFWWILYWHYKIYGNKFAEKYLSKYGRAIHNRSITMEMLKGNINLTVNLEKEGFFYDLTFSYKTHAFCIH